MSERTYPTTSERTLTIPVTPPLQLSYSCHLCFQDFPTSNSSSCPTDISSHSHSYALLPSSVLVLFLSHSPISQNINNICLRHQHFTCIPLTHSHCTHSCTHIVTIFLPSLISAPSNKKSCFQIRWIILASELGKKEQDRPPPSASWDWLLISFLTSVRAWSTQEISKQFLICSKYLFMFLLAEMTINSWTR